MVSFVWSRAWVSPGVVFGFFELRAGVSSVFDECFGEGACSNLEVFSLGAYPAEPQEL